MTKTFTFLYHDHLIKQIQESVSEQSNTAYYVYTGVHGDVVGNTVPTPSNNNRDVLVNAYNNMVFGKRLTANDVSLLVRNVPWESGKAFAMYDDNDADLLTKDFFCIVDEGSLIHIYKCLDNFFGANSTVEPQYAFVSEAANFVFQTSDNYVWKYMCSVPQSDKIKFETQTYFPVTTNSLVSESAVAGAIDVIKISRSANNVYGGKRYDNYTTGTFTASNLRISGNNKLYSLRDSNSSLSTVNGFYTGCLVYISSGSGAGQYKTVTDYFNNSNGSYIVLDEPFSVNPENGSAYEIYPKVNINGAGIATTNAVARALVDANTSNSIYKVEMLEKGVGYVYATANVVANAVVSNNANFEAATLTPIYGPARGHGYDPSSELGADTIEFSILFSNTEGNTIPVDNRFQQFGLMKDPMFANVNIEMANKISTFVAGETVYKVDPIRINSNVFVTTNSSIVTALISSLSGATIVSSGTVDSYVPNDILTIEGGTAAIAATVKVISTEVRSAAINTAGYGYASNTTFTVSMEGGNGSVVATFTVGANDTSNAANITISEAGSYTTNPSSLGTTTFKGGYNVIQLSANNGDDWVDQTVANVQPSYAVSSNGSAHFVAVGKDGTIQTSVDGATWVNRTPATNAHMYGVAWGNGTYVAVGANGKIQSSEGGLIWALRTTANTNDMKAVTYGNGVFVAVGGNGAIQTSGDGISWTNRTTANTENMNGVTYGNGVYVAVGDNGAIQSSTDALTWTNRTTANTENMNAVGYGDGVYFAVGDNGAVQSSTDGTTWVNRTTANTNHMKAAAYGNSTYMAMGELGSIQTSADASTWADEGGTSNTNNVWGVSFGTGVGFVAVGGEGTGMTATINMGVEAINVYTSGAYSVLPTSISNNVPVNSGNGIGAVLSLSFSSAGEADFLNQLEANDFVYLVAGDGTAVHLTRVSSITNSTYLQIASNSLFACSETYMYLPRVSTTAVVNVVANTTNILLANVDGQLTTNDIIVGYTSGAKCECNTIYRNEVSKNQDTFVQMYKYYVSISSNNFVENEVVYQGNSVNTATATALVHSVGSEGNSTVLYTTNQIGQFSTANLIFGANSSAAATINNKWTPELVVGSGDILFIENLEEVERASDKAERFQILITTA